MSRRRGSAAARLVLLLAAMMCVHGGMSAASAQDRGRDRGRGESREEMEARFRRQLGRMIQERLRLQDEEAEELFAVMRGFETRRRELARAESEVRRRVDALLVEDEADDAAADALLDELEVLRTREHDLRAEELAAWRASLSPVQVLRLQELMEQVARRIRSLRRGDDSGRRRRGRGDAVHGPGIITVPAPVG